jgi:hypothetical protein
VSEIENSFARHLVVNHGTHRNLEFFAMAIGAGAVAALTMAAPLALVFGVVAELEQSILVAGGNHGDIAAPAPIAAARTAAGNIFLPAKSKTAVSAVTGLHENSYFINEHGKPNIEKPPVLVTGGLWN